MSEPRTPTAKRLLGGEAIDSSERHENGEWTHTRRYLVEYDDLLAIEQEAAAAERERLREAANGAEVLWHEDTEQWVMSFTTLMRLLADPEADR